MFPLRQDSKDPSFTDAQNLLILHMAKVNAAEFVGMILKGSADTKCLWQNWKRINVQSLFEKCLCSEFKEKTNAHCFVWFELSSQAGLAVPEPQKNVRGELVILQNSYHFHFYRLVQKKHSWWPGESWDWFGRKRRKHRQHCPTSQVHPWQDLLWNRLQIMISSFKGELVVQIAIILINSQACWDNRVCCNQYEHQLKCSEREIYQSHQYQQNPQEHGQQTISCSVESSLPGWTTL